MSQTLFLHLVMPIKKILEKKHIKTVFYKTFNCFKTFFTFHVISHSCWFIALENIVMFCLLF